MVIPAEIPPDVAARIPERSIDYSNVEPGRNARRDATLVADALVVGSGAGGAVAACLLAEAGFDVLLIEEGGLHKTESFSTNVLEMMRALYRDFGASMILGKPGIIFAEGRCAGGSTVINGGACVGGLQSASSSAGSATSCFLTLARARWSPCSRRSSAR
jgi:hypothetical protein